MSDSPKILGPDGREIRSRSSGLVDAQGRAVRSRLSDDVPNKPRLRDLEFVAVNDQGADYLVARDPLGVCEDSVALRAEVLPLLQLLDGERSVEEITSNIVAESGDPSHAEAIKSLIEDLDQLYLLESPRFEARKTELAEIYKREPVRKAALAGSVYPADPEELKTVLGAHYAEAKAIASAADYQSKRPETTVAIAIPHLDLRRAGPLASLGFLSLPESPPPDVIFVMGTGHVLYENSVAITGKTFETPIGNLKADQEIVNRVIERAGEGILAEETAHRDEHSIEFTAVHIAYRYGDHPKLVPVLCGGFSRLLMSGSSPEQDVLYQSTVSALRDEYQRAIEEGRRVAAIAAIDLSHVGARFGDSQTMDQTELDRIRDLDEKALAAAASGQPGDWYEAVASHQDSTRICGYSALHCLLSVTQPGPGTLLRYLQSNEPDGSTVTCASLAWPPATS